MKKIITLLLLILPGFSINTYCNSNDVAQGQKEIDIKLLNNKISVYDYKLDTINQSFAKISALDKLRFNNVSKSILKRSNAIFAICFIIGLFVIIVTLYFNSLLNKNISNINASLRDTNNRLKKEIDDLRQYIDTKVSTIKGTSDDNKS